MTVTIESDRGRLRLRWLYQGKRVNLSLGVDDNPTGRAFAKQKAGQIETDLTAGHYDETLLRYKPRTLGKKATDLTVVELFEKYTSAMRSEKGLSRGGLSKYQCVLAHLKRLMSDRKADAVGTAIAGNFTSALLEQASNHTVKTYLYLLSACWEWAKGKYHVSENPWSDCITKIKPHQTKRVKPFNEGEIRAILAGFQSNRYYSHYYPVVRFLFATGVRPGEAFGLRWGSVADDFSHVVIREAVSRGEKRDRTKTGKSRVVYLSSAMAETLRSTHHQLKPSPPGLVFPSPKGKPLDDHNFSRRAWRSVLESVGVEYRSPYAIRHSAISHALSNGANPIELSDCRFAQIIR